MNVLAEIWVSGLYPAQARDAHVNALLEFGLALRRSGPGIWRTQH
jgi:hypothetical protein